MVAIVCLFAFMALWTAISTLDVRAQSLEELRRIKSPPPEPEPDGPAAGAIVPSRDEILVLDAGLEPVIPDPAPEPVWPEVPDWSAYERPAWLRVF